MEKDDFVVVFYRNLREQWVEEQKNKNFKFQNIKMMFWMMF